MLVLALKEKRMLFNSCNYETTTNVIFKSTFMNYAES